MINLETRRKKALELAKQGMKRLDIRNSVRVDYKTLKVWLDSAGVAPLTNRPRPTEAKEATRREEAIKLAKQGMPRREIAIKLHANYDIVKRVLDEAGIEPMPQSSIRQKCNGVVNPMWNTSDENLRRVRIAKKASQGARAALEAMGAQ